MAWRFPVWIGRAVAGVVLVVALVWLVLSWFHANQIRAEFLVPRPALEGYPLTVSSNEAGRVTVTRTDGSIIAGVLLRQGDTELILRDAANREHRVPAGQVASRTVTATSLMPPGLTASLREDELVDLLAFLSALGRDMRVPTDRYVRRYALLEDTPELLAILDNRGIPWAAENPDAEGLTWHTVWSRVDGSIPTGVIPNGSADISNASWGFRVARFDLDVLRAGTVALEVNDPIGLMYYANGERIPDARKVTTIDFAAGRHTVSVVMVLRDYATNATSRPPDMPLQIRLVDAPGRAAQVQVVSTD